MKSLLATVKSFVASLLLWSLFVGGLAASTASGAVLDGTGKNVATYAGIDTMDGVKGIATAVGMGLVSLGAAGGLVSGRKKQPAPAPNLITSEAKK